MNAVKVLGQGQLGTGLTTIYTCPSAPYNAKAQVMCLWICNTDGSSRTFTLRAGSAATAANSLFEAQALAANTTIQYGSENGYLIVLNAGDTVQGLASSASKITVSLYGFEVLG